MNRRLKVIILDVGRGRRRLDGDQSVPRALETVEASQTNLHWLLNALPASRSTEAVYIGGYHLEKVVEQFPQLKVRFHGGMDRLGELPALADLDWDEQVDHLVVRADTLLMADGIDRMLGRADSVGAGFCSSGAERFSGIVFVGADRVGATAQALTRHVETSGDGDLGQLFALLPDVTSVDLSGVATPTSDREAVRALVFRGKARTLEQLEGLVRSATIAPQMRFDVHAWQSRREQIVAGIQRQFGRAILIARSSTASEDNHATSGAGEFHSELDIDAGRDGAIVAGVDRVVASYSRDGRQVRPEDEVLIQTQIKGLALSGVVLTRDPSSGAPYFVISYEAGSGRSDVVTSGAAGSVRTAYASWDAPATQLGADLAPVITMIRELVDLTHSDALDIEFGCAPDGTVHVFQVRPMVAGTGGSTLMDADLDGIRHGVKEFVAAQGRRHPGLLGDTTLFASMSDWNPVEMVGGVPGPMALSLYQSLIGNEAWATSRARIGYRFVEDEPLIVSLGGRPYVDVRKSLNSLLPAQVSDAAGERWVTHCLEHLRRAPELQDKLEFDITVTCLDLAWEAREERFERAGLTAADIATFKQALAHLTNRFVAQTEHPITNELARLAELDRTRRALASDASPTAADAAMRIRHLVTRTRDLGAIPFAVLARFGFVAMSLLRSLRDESLISGEEFDEFLRTTPTVAGELAHDVARFGRGEVTREHMIATYGHLRPHSYEITADSYAMRPEMFTAAPGVRDQPGHLRDHVAFIDSLLSGSRDARIQERIDALGLTFTTRQMLTFMADAISARERAKFEYMKAVDTLLELLAQFGGCQGLEREQVGFLTLDEVLRYATDSRSGATPGRLTRAIRYRRKRQLLAEALRLPEVVAHEDDVFGFALLPGKPNFITRKHVTGRVRVIESYAEGLDLNGDIIAIRAADPGFDWIFGHAITGLITEYGGAASHMAIRAAEFGLPAAIGCGRLIFDSLSDGGNVSLDCANERVIAR